MGQAYSRGHLLFSENIGGNILKSPPPPLCLSGCHGPVIVDRCKPSEFVATLPHLQRLYRLNSNGPFSGCSSSAPDPFPPPPTPPPPAPASPEIGEKWRPCGSPSGRDRRLRGPRRITSTRTSKPPSSSTSPPPIAPAPTTVLGSAPASVSRGSLSLPPSLRPDLCSLVLSLRFFLLPLYFLRSTGCDRLRIGIRSTFFAFYPPIAVTRAVSLDQAATRTTRK